jgi:SAM-dependent methyltransferase
MTNGWSESAAGWIADLGDEGDFGRRFVLDPPMLERVTGRGFATALDVGCGEGRFCRMLKARGIAAVGIDPTEALLETAKRRDPMGDYRIGRAEALDFGDASFDLVVSYVTLVDIEDIDTAIPEMVRVLRPGGTLLVANLSSFNSAGQPAGWQAGADGVKRFVIDHYMTDRADWVAWRGIRIRNWHRPLSRYMSLFLGEGLELRSFLEPMPTPDANPEARERHYRVPYFVLMEWRKPAA